MANFLRPRPVIEEVRPEARPAPLPEPRFGGCAVAVLLPCYNEEVAIAEVIRGFREALPEAENFVYDNNSSDGTVEAAGAAGAVVRSESRQGKGNVVRRMFADIDADVYLMADGDLTYDASRAAEMVDLLVRDNLDMVVGTRLDSTGQALFRSGHRFGNRLLTGVVGFLFGSTFTDMLSGYRVFSRRFVKSFPAISSGFETETELTIHALQLKMPVAECRAPYFARPEGSVSKLSTYRDGLRILRMIVYLLKEFRPTLFFSAIGAALAFVSLVTAAPLLLTYLETGLVPRFPTAILSTGLMLLAFLSFACGFILDSVSNHRLVAKRLHYLGFAAVGTQARRAG
jgi:hypothetical protein